METYCASSDESIREKTLNLITHVEIEPAHVSDVHALIPALESTKERGLVPREVLADSLYGSDENRQTARDLGVEVISPVMGAPKEETLSLAVFGVNLFRAARVKRALDALRTLPGTALSGIGAMIWVIKERFLNTGNRLRNIFNAATEITPYDLKIAA
jgi:hypothetical protein